MVLGRDAAVVQVGETRQVGQHEGGIVVAADWIIGQTQTRQAVEMAQRPHL